MKYYKDKKDIHKNRPWFRYLNLSLGNIIAAYCLLSAPAASATPYEESAHGDSDYGVNRSAITSKGYVQGNCSHCHEQHASIGNSEPVPVNGGPSDFALYTSNFNISLVTNTHTSNITNPYAESDVICFSCHNDSGSIMQVVNKTYSETFGGFTPSYPIESIYDAFGPILSNNHTHHNLKDIYLYAKDNFDFWGDSSNPCVACHNPHIAKRNNTDVDNPVLTPISRPTDHENLWGDDASERMDSYVGADTYQAPYHNGSTAVHEPGGIADYDGSQIPDYNTFCMDCHAHLVAATNAGTLSANPDTPAGYITAIDWSSSGDIHGGASRYSGNYDSTTGATLREPYDTSLGSTSPNYTLSCLDCHEPHGTVLYNVTGTSQIYSSALLRKEINGGEVECLTDVGVNCGWPQDDADWTPLGLCRRCHNIDKHCGGQIDCLGCHYHGARNIGAGCGSTWEKGAF